MDPDVTSAIRDIFVMAAAGVFVVLCLALFLVVVKIYRPLRETVSNAEKSTKNIGAITDNLAAVSEETSQNLLLASRNAVVISENLKEGSEDLSTTVRAAREAAGNVAAAASTVKDIADMVSRVGTLGISGGGSAGVGTLLRIVRGLFGGARRPDDGGAE